MYLICLVLFSSILVCKESLKMHVLKINNAELTNRWIDLYGSPIQLASHKIRECL